MHLSLNACTLYAMKQQISSIQKVLNTWAIVLILWSVYRVYFRTDMPIWFDEFISKPLIFLLPVMYYVSTQEKQKFWKAVDLRTKNWKAGIIFGLASGLLFFVTGFVVQLIRNDDIQEFMARGSVGMVFYYILIAFATSFSEEILSRGFVLKRLYEDSKNAINSVFFASFLFFFLHIPILFTDPDMRGMILLQVMATDVLLSFAVSFLYLQKKSVWVPILIHTFYNLSLYLFL